MKKALFVTVVLLATVCSLGAQNADSTTAEKHKAVAPQEEISQAEYDDLIKRVNDVAGSDAPVNARLAMLNKIIEEYNAKHPETAFRLVKKEELEGQAKDKTRLLEDKMITQLVEMNNEAYSFNLNNSNGTQAQPLSRGGTSREELCIQKYCAISSLPYSCNNPSNPYQGQYCIVVNVSLYSQLTGDFDTCLLIDRYSLAAACSSVIQH